MDKFSYTAGVVAIIASLIMRFVFPKMVSLTNSRDMTVEEKSVSADIALLGLTGILWIVSGAVQTLTKDWLESGIWGIIAQFILTVAPILLFRTILWFKYKGHSNR
jgi:hypothetical protein